MRCGILLGAIIRLRNPKICDTPLASEDHFYSLGCSVYDFQSWVLRAVLEDGVGSMNGLDSRTEG
jgi:hypothetical protein